MAIHPFSFVYNTTGDGGPSLVSQPSCHRIILIELTAGHVPACGLKNLDLPSNTIVVWSYLVQVVVH